MKTTKEIIKTLRNAGFFVSATYLRKKGSRDYLVGVDNFGTECFIILNCTKTLNLSRLDAMRSVMDNWLKCSKKHPIILLNSPYGIYVASGMAYYVKNSIGHTKKIRSISDLPFPEIEKWLNERKEIRKWD